MQIVGLKTDYLDCPLGLETSAPLLSWRMESDTRGIRQAKYRVVVSSTKEAAERGEGNLWDSGEVATARSLGIKYQGRPLVSRQRCFWRVDVWDNKGNSAKSEISWWEMGLLSSEDWSAAWLAVEDAVARGDRQVGLRWISGSAVDEQSPSRKFRLKLELHRAASGGVLLIGSKVDLLGLWIDGTAIRVEPRPRDFYALPPLQQFTLPSLGSGSHLIAIEVVAQGGISERHLMGPIENTRLDAMTVLARFELEGGQMVRVGAGPDWRTSVTRDAEWFTVDYEECNWEQATVIGSETAQPWPPAPAVNLRREFVVERPVGQARLYITALGAYEARLNGSKVGEALLTPESSYFTKRARYRVHDVTKLLRSGGNAFGLTVGDGWFASDLVIAGRYPWLPPPRRVLAQLELSYSDGSRETIATGPGWRLASSPIVCSEIYDGEIYDARLEQTDWDESGFDDSAWENAQIAEAPPCRLTAHVSAPIRATQILRAQAITNPGPGVWVFDFSQNFAGWCRLHVKGSAGARIEMKFGEILLPSGKLDQSNLWGAKQTDVYILRGDESGETYEPHFTYHGFRYVEVTGLPEAPSAGTLEGIVIHSDLPMTGRLKVGHPLVRQIWLNTLWSQRSYFMGTPIEPQRRERVGWLGDQGVFWDAAAFNMDVSAFTRKLMQNASDNQNPDGSYSLGAPFPYSSVPYPFALIPAPGWADAPIIQTWTVWRRYGDTAIVEQNWEAMNRQVQFVLKHNPDCLWREKRSDFGDWLAVDWQDEKTPKTPHDLIGTAYWGHSARLLAEMGEAVGRPEDASSLRKLHAVIRQAFVKAFVTEDGRVSNETQTSYILALKFGLVPDQLKSKAAERLIADIRKRGGALTTGMLGTQYILDVLADAGYVDVAHDLLLRTEYPSWGYMIARGATTMWESWNERISWGRPGETAPNSYNHMFLGSVSGFLFRRIAGIDVASPGFERIVIRPALDPRIQRSGGDYDSVMGRISTDWAHDGNRRLELRVTIPANTMARIHLPAGRESRIEESGAEISTRPEILIVSRCDEEALIEVGSGLYRFLVSR